MSVSRSEVSTEFRIKVIWFIKVTTHLARIGTVRLSLKLIGENNLGRLGPLLLARCSSTFVSKILKYIAEPHKSDILKLDLQGDSMLVRPMIFIYSCLLFSSMAMAGGGDGGRTWLEVARQELKDKVSEIEKKCASEVDERREIGNFLDDGEFSCKILKPTKNNDKNKDIYAVECEKATALPEKKSRISKVVGLHISVKDSCEIKKSLAEISDLEKCISEFRSLILEGRPSESALYVGRMIVDYYRYPLNCKKIRGKLEDKYSETIGPAK